MSEDRSKESRLGRTLILLILCVVLFVGAGWLAYPRLDEFATLEDSSQYVAHGKDLIDKGEYLKAADLLGGVVRYHRPGGVEPYALLALAHERAGNVSEAEYQRARSEFQKAWLSPMVKMPAYLSDKWGPTIKAGRLVVNRLGSGAKSAPKELLIPILENTFRKWRIEGGSEIDKWASEMGVEDIMAILIGSGDLLVYGKGEIGKTGAGSPVSILVESSGIRWASPARITIGNKRAIESDESKPGFILAYLMRDNEEPVVQQFDTAGDAKEAIKMRDLIRYMPEGRIVAVAVNKGIGPETDRWIVEEILALIGVELPSYRFLRARLMDGAPLAAVGVRGAEPGTGICNLGEAERNKAAVLILAE